MLLDRPTEDGYEGVRGICGLHVSRWTPECGGWGCWDTLTMGGYVCVSSVVFLGVWCGSVYVYVCVCVACICVLGVRVSVYDVFEVCACMVFAAWCLCVCVGGRLCVCGVSVL